MLFFLVYLCYDVMVYIILHTRDEWMFRYLTWIGCIVVSPLFFCSLAHASNWNAYTVEYSDWQPKKKQCNEWVPSKNTFEWGRPMRQSQNCDVISVRYRIFLEKNKITGDVRERERKEERRLLKKTDWRTVRGSLDRAIYIDAKDKWEPWALNERSVRNCAPLLGFDIASQVDWGKIVSAPITCEGAYERRKPIVEHWLSGKTVRLLDKEPVETKKDKVVFLDASMGVKDRWLSPQVKYTRWENAGTRSCNENYVNHEWLSSHVAWGKDVIAKIPCTQKQKRKAIRYERSLSGNQREIEQQTRYRDKKFSEFVGLQGSRDEVINKEWIIAQDWHPASDEMKCETGLSEEWVDWGTEFTRLSKCEGQEERVYALLSNFASGKNKIEETRIEQRESVYYLLNNVTGERDSLIAQNVDSRRSEWNDDGQASCGVWAPYERSVPSKYHYLQLQECQQEQERLVESLSRWQSGDKWLLENKERRTVSVNNFRIAKGLQRMRRVMDPISILPGDSNVAQSKKFSFGSLEGFDRIRLEIIASEESKFEVAIESRDESIALPNISGKRNVLFFNLSDYDIQSNESWSITVVESLDSESGYTFTFTLEEIVM